MNKSVLFYPDAADELNEIVQKKIAPHLFLFCNYNPIPLKAFSTDGRFLVAVVNLYKLLIDSGVVNRINRISKEAKIQFDLDKLQKFSDISNNLRTVVGHNLSCKNGTERDILRYERWLKSITGKERMELPEDYEKPLRRLEEMAKSSINILKQFVEKASQILEKNNMIAIWENYIIEFYCKENNKNIFLGQLKDAYAATHRSNLEDDQSIGRSLSVWICNTYYHKENVQIQDLQDMLNQFGHKWSVDAKVQIQGRIDELQSVMGQREAVVAKDCNCSIEKLRSSVYLYREHYCRSLKPKLHEALKEIKETRTGTMMPYDIMQMIIKHDLLV